MQFLPKKYCRLQLGCQTYATCFATCNEIIFFAAEYLNYFKLLGSFSKNCETSCSGGVTHCNLSRSIAKSRSCFYFLCNLQRNFSLRDQLQTWRVTRGSLPCNLQCNAIALPIARKIASCDMAFRHANIKKKINSYNFITTNE